MFEIKGIDRKSFRLTYDAPDESTKKVESIVNSDIIHPVDVR